MSKNVDSLGRELKVGDIIAWAGCDRGKLRFALIRGVENLNKKDYYGNEKYKILTVIFQSKWNYNYDTKEGFCTYGTKKYYMDYPDRGVIITDQVLSMDSVPNEIEYLIEARKELLNGN